MMKERFKSEAREWMESLVIALIIALFIRTFVVQAFKIPSSSMVPFFHVNDRIFVNKFIYGARIPFTDLRFPSLRQPKRGDVIVFIAPKDRKKDFVKRLVATEGETVEIRDGRIYIDGKIVDEPASIRAITYQNGGEFGREAHPVKVPKDCYFALGDNSGSSADSRYWGFVPKKNLHGKVIFIYWPLDRIRVVK